MLSLIPFSLTFTFWGNPERANVRCLALSHPNVNYNFFLYVYILFLDIYFYHFFSPIFGLVPMVFLMMHIECYRSGLSVSMLDIVYVHGHRAERAYITGTFSWFLCFTSYALHSCGFFFTWNLETFSSDPIMQIAPMWNFVNSHSIIIYSDHIYQNHAYSTCTQSIELKWKLL